MGEAVNAAFCSTKKIFDEKLDGTKNVYTQPKKLELDYFEDLLT